MNDTDIRNAVNALIFFRNSFCMDIAKTEEMNKPVFRCKQCCFQDENGFCSIKVFIQDNGTAEEIQRGEVMLR